MTNWVRAANPFWLMTDLTGGILDDSYYLFVLENTLPYQPETIYQDPQMNVAWSNPIQFNADGTLPNNMYWDDETVYRLEVRQGPTQSDPLIRLAENFKPVGSGGGSNDISVNADNQITNPQFALVNFETSISESSITNPSPIGIAPGWELTLVGTGSYTITQDLLNINDEEPNNSSFALNFNLSGWNSATLTQRFSNMGNLWSEKFVSAQLTAKQSSGTTSTISASLIPSTGTPTPLFSGNMTSAYNVFSGAVEVTQSTNTDFPPDSFMVMSISLPPVGNTTITSIQIVPTDAEINLSYEQDTYERQVDNTWHYYKDAVIMQPKTSILTGWNFPLNPWQLRSRTVATVTNQAEYVADQTIIYQQSGGSTVSAGATTTNNRSLEVHAVSSNSRFALINYIAPVSILPYWGTNLSALVRLRLTTTNATTVRFKMRLIYRTTPPPTIGVSEPISSWTGDGDPMFSAGWAEVEPLIDNVYTANSVFSNFSFDKFVLPTSVATPYYVGVVFYTIDSLDSSGTPDVLYIDDINLVANDFALESSSITYNQALSDCQFYYEKTYPDAVFFGDVTPTGQVKVPMNIDWPAGTFTNDALYLRSFDVPYQEKNSTPTITFYSPSTGTAGNVEIEMQRNGANPTPTVGSNPTDLVLSGNYTQLNPSFHNMYMRADDTSTTKMEITSGAFGDGAYLNYQATFDSRLGR